MNNRHLKIFLADDDDDDRELFHEALNSIGFSNDLVMVNNGEKVFNFFKERSHIPDFVFLDINMPKKNGIECLKFIKSMYPRGNFHIIMLSTSSSLNVVEQSYEYGASVYIQKPSTFNDLVRYLGYCLTELTNGTKKEDFFLNKLLENKLH